MAGSEADYLKKRIRRPSKKIYFGGPPDEKRTIADDFWPVAP
jgi:hypothetical protein